MIYYCKLFFDFYPKTGCSVSFPEFPGIYSTGNSKEEALKIAKDTIESVIKSRLEDKDHIPATIDRSNEEGLYPIEIDQDVVQLVLKNKMKILKKRMESCKQSNTPIGSNSSLPRQKK